jgi:prepilin-type N-terminal cleavage/methylation domain-containing protein
MRIVNVKREKGFTLIEVIVSLVLLGIMAAFLATAIVMAVNGFFFTRDSATKSQKAQLALARISRELLDMTTINSAPSSTSVAYTTSNGQFQIVKTGNQITLEKTDTPVIAAQTLIDDVSTNYGSDSFLVYTNSGGSAWTYTANDISALYQIKVVIKLNGYAGVQTLNFETTINPRNNTLSNAPKLY